MIVPQSRFAALLVSRVSLALCHALRHEHVHEGVPTVDGETTLRATPLDGEPSQYVIDPWPFRDETVTLVYDGRGSRADSPTKRRCATRSIALLG